MNVPWASTRASVVYAIRAMTDPARATNDGILRAVEIICPRGSVLNPEPPGAVSVRHNTCQRLADTLIRAASLIWPDRAVASSTVAFFGMNLASVSPRTGTPSVMAEVAGGGTGAHGAGDGLDGVDTYMANVGLMPVEVAESSYSVRIRRTELIAGSQGDGEYRGGLGLRRDYEVLGRRPRSPSTPSRPIRASRPAGCAAAPTASRRGSRSSDRTASPSRPAPKGAMTLPARIGDQDRDQRRRRVW